MDRKIWTHQIVLSGSGGFINLTKLELSPSWKRGDTSINENVYVVAQLDNQSEIIRSVQSCWHNKDP